MASTLKIKQLQLPSNIVQGPLAGYSCAPFRLLAQQYGTPGFCVTEMLSAKTLLNLPKKKQHRYIYKDPNEGLLSFQLASNEPKELAEAVKIAEDSGADLIDLNCGCPVNKIRRKGCGSSLLNQPHLLKQLISAMRENTHLPISIKIRVDGNSQEQNNAEIIKIIHDSGLDFLTVHGRHWTDNYEVACHDDQIAHFVKSLAIPVIGNGDSSCAASVKRLLDLGCAGVMIARAGVGQPWLYHQIQTELAGSTFTPPSLIERGNMLLQHILGLIELLQSEIFAIIQARKFAKYYARNQDWRSEFHQRFITATSLQEIQPLIHTYFRGQIRGQAPKT